MFCLRFFSNDTPTTDISNLSLHDALPISRCGLLRGGWTHRRRRRSLPPRRPATARARRRGHGRGRAPRSEEHTSELQSHVNLVCRLLLEKKKTLNETYGAADRFLTASCRD